MTWWHNGDEWRWNPRHHATPTFATIVVTDLSVEQKAERSKRISEGARVVPFGFARALAPADPLLWEGDDS